MVKGQTNQKWRLGEKKGQVENRVKSLVSTRPGEKVEGGCPNMKSVETSEGCGRQGRRRERVKAQQDNSQVPLSKDQVARVL